MLRNLILVAALLGAGPTAAQVVLVSEAMSGNSGSLLDEDGDSPDWIELHNPGVAPVQLAGFGLSDNEDEPFRWMLPDVEVAPGGYLVVFASGKDRSGTAAWHTVVRRGDGWRFLTGDQAIPADWVQRGFEDSAWREGVSGFGYGDGDDATSLSTVLSVFGRTRFMVDDPVGVSGVEFHIDFDDGYVAYLNGTEIAREGIGTAGVIPPGTQPAATSHEARLYQGLELEGTSVSPSLLVAGENALAVQVHNVSASSSDLTMIPFLSLALPASAEGPGLSSEISVPVTQLLHASFRLSADEKVCITAPDGTAVDCLQLQEAPDDVSVGRSADGSVVLFDTPTPGSGNAGTGATGAAPAISVSLESGFYSSSASVSLTSPSGGPIAFTIDGSEPTAASPRYVSPIRLFATRVLRARAMDEGMIPGPVDTRTYIVNSDIDLPVVAINTDPDLLFHPQTGMYERGPNAEGSFPFFGANFWEDREIPVEVEWLEPSGTRALGHGAGMKIYGGWSRGHAQKSVSLFARGRYGPGEFEHRFFEDRSYSLFEAVVLRNSGNDWDRSMLRDGFMQTLVRDTEIDRLAYRPVVVYLNGDYWGIHNVREKINEHYLAAISGSDADEVDLLEFSDGSNGAVAIQGTGDAWNLLLARINASDIGTAQAYEEVGAMMDLDNYIDYQIAQIFFDNRDWPGNNTKVWRPRTAEGRFRWILYDTDFGWGIWNDNAWQNNTLLFAMEPNGPNWPNPPWSTLLFRRLLMNSEFRREFVLRYSDLVSHTLHPDRTSEVLSDLSAAIRPEMGRHTDRWGVTRGWSGVVSQMHTYAASRPAAMTGHMQAYFGLGGRSVVVVNVEGSGGRVQVNRLVTTGPWFGQYFDGIPLTVTAIPDRGYRFSHWSGTASGSDRSVNVDPAGGHQFVAHFEPASGDPSALVINEIHYNPAGLSGEWVEILNAGPQPVSVAGWRLSDGSGEAIDLPATTLAPGATLALCEDAAAFERAYGLSCTGDWTFGLSDGGDTVFLHDSGGTLADSVAYDDRPPWPSEPDGGGRSLELTDPQEDNSLPNAWRPSDWEGGSPAGRNSTAVEVETLDLPSDSFEFTVYPNPFAGRASLSLRLPEASTVVVEFFDILGRRLSERNLGVQPSGVTFLPDLLEAQAAGLYLVRVRVEGQPALAVPVVRIR